MDEEDISAFLDECYQHMIFNEDGSWCVDVELARQFVEFLGSDEFKNSGEIISTKVVH